MKLDILWVWMGIVGVVWSIGYCDIKSLEIRNKCKDKSDFDKRFCVEMLDTKRLRSYACIIENKADNCTPSKETIDDAIFNICGFK